MPLLACSNTEQKLRDIRYQSQTIGQVPWKALVSNALEGCYVWKVDRTEDPWSQKRPRGNQDPRWPAPWLSHRMSHRTPVHLIGYRAGERIILPTLRLTEELSSDVAMRLVPASPNHIQLPACWYHVDLTRRNHRLSCFLPTGGVSRLEPPNLIGWNFQY